MSSSTNASTSSNDEEKRDWSGLPSEITANILGRIGVDDILENAQRVCTAWRKICRDDPTMWRVIKIKSHNERGRYKQVVDRSQGQLVDISIRFPNDELLLYVANRSRQLKRLEFIYYLGPIVTRICEILKEFPLLEELTFYTIGDCVKKEVIETAGRYCPILKTLKVNNRSRDERRFKEANNEVAIAIGENLHGLRHLELIGSIMGNTGLKAILDGCRHLETLDLRDCFNIDLEAGDMGIRCVEQVESLKLPNDSLEGSPCYHVDVTNLIISAIL